MLLETWRPLEGNKRVTTALRSPLLVRPWRRGTVEPMTLVVSEERIPHGFSRGHLKRWINRCRHRKPAKTGLFWFNPVKDCLGHFHGLWGHTARRLSEWAEHPQAGTWLGSMRRPKGSLSRAFGRERTRA